MSDLPLNSMSTVCRVLFEEEQHAFREAIEDATTRHTFSRPVMQTINFANGRSAKQNVSCVFALLNSTSAEGASFGGLGQGIASLVHAHTD